MPSMTHWPDARLSQDGAWKLALRSAGTRLNGLPQDSGLASDPAELVCRAGLAPDPWQERLLRSGAPRILMNCSRQSGKSSMTAAIALHTALYEPESLVLFLSPGQRQSTELFRKCLYFYRALGRPVPADAENALSLALTNGSRIVSLPGSEGTVRGYSGAKLILVDEASRVADELYYAIRPMLAVSAGRLIACSTPFGRRGWWFRAWVSDEPWERYEVPATECPRISAEFLAEEWRSMGEYWYKQEYECQFTDAETQAFREADITRAYEDGVGTWDL